MSLHFINCCASAVQTAKFMLFIATFNYHKKAQRFNQLHPGCDDDASTPCRQKALDF